jgi:hypothetical protein
LTDDAPGEDVLGLEAGIEREQLAEARQQQPRSNQQHERQRHLRHDEPPPYVPRAPAGSAGPPVLPQHGAHVDPRQLHGGHGAHHEPQQQCHAEGEGHDHAVHADLVGARNV